MPGNKSNNYDTTAKRRVARRAKRITDSGLVERKVIMDVDDVDTVRDYAKIQYEKRGKALKP